MTATAIKPVVGLPTCSKTIDGLDFQVGGEKYLNAVADGSGAMPVLLPSPDTGIPATALSSIVDLLDGLLVTGSPSNVEPRHYGGPASVAGTLHDPARDSVVLPLIPLALEAGIPILAICRGVQEMNVAMGGTLHQRLQDVPGRTDHRSNPKQTIEERYGPAHMVELVAGSQVAGLANDASEILVNSLHAQGIDALAPGLIVEATAPDGTIEAVRASDARAFALGIQWHPEWQFFDTEFGRNLFAAFGDAARRRAAEKRGEPATAAARVA